MAIRIVHSKQNARLKELRKTLADQGRNERGLVGIEGPNLLEEAVRARLAIKCVFVAQGSEQLLKSSGLPEQVEVLAMRRDLLDSVLTTDTPQAIAALVEPPDWTWAHLLGTHKSGAALVVLLAGLQDPGNLGNILRSAEAFGADGVICLPGTVNAWNPKAVRASAGSLFRVPLLNVSEDEALEKLREAGIRVLTTTAKVAQPPDRVDLAVPVALLIGNEGNGVPANLAVKANEAITIPCPGPVESLNAAVATSVLLYEAVRQRAVKGGMQKLRGGKR